MESHPFTHEQAKTFYDRFGAKQNLQGFYEDRAIGRLLVQGDFKEARAVVEFGCGTGRLAGELLGHWLGPGASYRGFDVSETMVRLARSRLGAFGDRARVDRTDGTPMIPLPAGTCDRFLSTYVFDLLSVEDIRGVLGEARRVLESDGRLCLTSLTFGQGPWSRFVSGLWRDAYSIRPVFVGGCRPLRLQDHVATDWKVLQREVLCSFGMCSEILIAKPG